MAKSPTIQTGQPNAESIPRSAVRTPHSPDFPIHGSTQMTVTSAGGVEFVRELGCNLVVLARENSLKEIERIQEAQRPGAGSNQCSVFSVQSQRSDAPTEYCSLNTEYSP